MNPPAVALFGYGFRPFFLLAGVAAAILVPLWAADFVFGGGAASGWPPTLWHAHEMLFGFIASALAGFLLTAVPSWTGRRGFAGAPLVLLTLLWFAGRVLVSTARAWPPLLVAIVDVAFVPVLALCIAGPLLRARNRNTPLLVLLAALTLTNVAFHHAEASHDAGSALRALLAGIDVMVLFVTLIGGRIVPAFTASGLRAQGAPAAPAAAPAITGATIVLTLTAGLTDVLATDARTTGVIAALTALFQGVRWIQWHPLATRRVPLVWVLHVAYAWLPVGFALKALACLTGAAVGAFWLHALTVGALSTMIVAVMTRAALGHTGRALHAGPLAVAAYLLLIAAALVRVFGLAVLAGPYPALILASASLWTAAFACYLWAYAPVLCSPRIDGKPG